MRLSKVSLAPVLLALAAPQIANAGVIVEFELKESELSTPETRQALLDRMTTFAMRSCEKGSVLATRAAIERCAEDLKEQFVGKIGHDGLTQLSERQPAVTYRSARR